MKISFAPSVMGCEKLKAGTEALLEEMKQIPENLEVRVEFNENPQLTAKRVGNQVQITCDKKKLLALKEICEKEIPETIQNLEEMKVLREDLWMSEAKPFGYELMDVKLGAVITRLNSTIRRTKKYLDGGIPCLEELEETRLPYFEKNADKRENRWSQIISGSDLIDTI